LLTNKSKILPATATAR